MKDAIRQIFGFGRGRSAASNDARSAPEPDIELGYEAATPYLNSQPGDLYEPPAPRVQTRADSPVQTGVQPDEAAPRKFA